MASDTELQATSFGTTVTPDKRLIANIARAHDTITSATSAILEKMTAFELDAVRSMERRADECKITADAHQAPGPNQERLENRVALEGWEHEHRRLVLEAAIARQNATEVRARFERHAGVRQSRAAADAEFENGPEAALLKRDRMTDKTVELHKELVGLVKKRKNTNDDRTEQTLDRRINDISTTLTKNPFCRVALDPPARRFVQAAKQRTDRSLEHHLSLHRKRDLGRSR